MKIKIPQHTYRTLGLGTKAGTMKVERDDGRIIPSMRMPRVRQLRMFGLLGFAKWPERR
jgi:hypothetical protein